jgi:hypothetical protein
VLLHQGNKFPSVVLAHAADVEEFYENIKVILEKIPCEKYNCNICRELKVIALLFGLQLGYTKCCCFLCEWNSGERKYHCIHKQRPEREFPILREKNVVNIRLIIPENVCLPQLHNKLGVIKYFVKAMDHNSAGFVYLEYSSPERNDAKTKTNSPSNKKVPTGCKIWVPARCSGKSSMGIIQKGHYQFFFLEGREKVIRQKPAVI